MPKPSKLRPPGGDDDQLHREAAELLVRVAGGDGAAFEELYDRFSGSLFALCLTFLADRAEAEDVLQDVFLLVWGRASKYDPALGKAVSWLMTIVRNRCLDRIRSRKRKQRVVERAGEAAEDDVVPTETVTGDVEAGERRQQIERALHELPEDQRKAIELAFLKGYTQTQVAELLGQPLGTVKARIRRGMLRMREFLGNTNLGGDASASGGHPR